MALAILLTVLALGPIGCLARSAGRGDIAAVKEYLADGDSVDSRDWKQRSALELAIILKREEMIDLLIAEGADLNRQGKGTRTPLIWASMRFGSPELIKKLIDAGADPDGSDRSGQTALLYSVLYGSPDQTKALTENGADLDQVMKPKWNTTVLNVAIRQRKSAAVQILVAGGADVDSRFGRDPSARELAARIPDLKYAIDRGVERRSGAPTRIAATPPATPRATRESSPSRPAPTPTPTPRRTQRAMLPASGAGDGLRLGEYHALVIGNNDYQYLPKLKTAVNDATAVSQVLRDQYGYSVSTLLNASRSEILQALSRYRRILDEDDNLIIYYAGHGWLDEDEDRGYWLPVDASQDSDVFWIPNESITSKTRAIRAKHIMVIADSCYSGKLVRGIHVNSTAPDYLKRLARRRARVVLTSGGVEPVSDAGGRNDHSIFADALLRVLRENTGVLEGHELFTKIRRPVAVNSDQIPEYSDIRKAGHDGGDFLFIVP